MAKTLMDFVRDAKSKITEVSVQDAQDLLAKGYQVVDVREPGEFEQGHIAGSINVPRGVLESVVDLANKDGNPNLQQGRDNKWLVLCRTSGRSAMATDVMQQMGFSDVINIAGGITAWNEANLPTVRENQYN
jgi:rhodanese-related sulfurtransferase